MPCTSVPLGNGTSAIVCTGRRPKRKCIGCGRAADLLCDWRVRDASGKPATCDAPLCAVCTSKPAPDKDLCPMHAGIWAERQAARRAGGSLTP